LAMPAQPREAAGHGHKPCGHDVPTPYCCAPPPYPGYPGNPAGMVPYYGSQPQYGAQSPYPSATPQGR
jgi:hypothetical protein